MRKRMVQVMGILLSVVMVAQNFCGSVTAANMAKVPLAVVNEEQTLTSQSSGVTVSTREDFMNALDREESLITVVGSITIGYDTTESGKMRPVEIPANTTIQGVENASISCRSPIQLAGDNVVIKNIKLTFESSNALGSVPHREIFLAGHSLILDKVYTKLQGAGGSIGGMGGTEEELLPTVYAGGFENSILGSHASLTIQNGSDDTKFQGIYMSHDEGTDSKVSYYGEATVNISPRVIVKDGIHTELNSCADIQVTGTGNISNVSFYGNSETTLTVQETNVYGATLQNVGFLVLDDNCYFELIDGEIQNISLKNRACLDLNTMENVLVMGDFCGGAYDENAADSVDERGVLVLKEDGFLEIQGAERISILSTTG